MTASRLRVLAAVVAAAASLPAAHADGRPACPRPELALPEGVTPALVERDWGNGDPHAGPPATLLLRACDGAVLDRMPLAAPLARLDPVPLRGAPRPTWLASADLTQEAGGDNGPLTLPVAVDGGHLVVVEARDGHGRAQPVHLVQSLKADWRRVTVQGHDELLAVQSAPAGGGTFTTTWRRYAPGRDGWQARERTAPGLWESDGDFPARRAFP